MRIFFEVYENKKDVIVDLNNYEIYQNYVDKLVEQNSEINLKEILSNMVSIMLESSDYSGVELEKLNIDKDRFLKLKKVLDNNFLISKSYIENEGLITENKKEQLYFVFDELRDFCISKQLLLDGENTEYAKLFNLCRELYDNRQSPLEGILKYSYIFFKNTERYGLCKSILETYCNEPIHRWKYKERNRWHESEKELFTNFGISIIFNDIENVLEFEKAYIFKVCATNDYDFWQMFFYFLANEYENITPDSSFLIDYICGIDSITGFNNLFSRLIQDNYERPYNEEERLVFQIYVALNRIKEKNAAFSTGTKQMILFICIADPTEYLFDEFLEEILSEQNITCLLFDQLVLKEVKDELLALIDRHKPTEISNRVSIYKYLRQVLEMSEDSNVED